MAISIDWGTRVISIPKADTQLVQATPTEIRSLDLDSFRQTLNDLQDDAEGMPFPTTHRHVAPIDVGGVTLARVVEIINGYTVTFEDGQYAVNLVGANSNVGDVTNVNQVSIRSANSAGLTYSKQVEDQSFTDARVWIDTINGLPGVQYPRGTSSDPVNNLSDALTIIQARGLPRRLSLRGSIIVGSGVDLSDFDILGESPTQSSIEFIAGSITDSIVLENLTVTGELSGNMTARQVATLATLNDFRGTMRACAIDGTINVADGATASLVDCHSDVAGIAKPVFEVGSNSQLEIRNYSGGVDLRNMTAGAIVNVDLDPGALVVGPSNTGGVLRVRGTGTIDDTSTGVSVTSELIDGNVFDIIAAAVAGNAEVSPDDLTVTIKDADGNTLRTLAVSADQRIRTIL